MNIILAIIEHIGPFVEALIWYRIMTNMLVKKYPKIYYIIAAAMITLLLFVKTVVFTVPAISNMRVIGSVITVTYTFVAGFLLFKNTFFEKLIWWGVYYIGLVTMELLAILIVPTLTGITIKEIQTNDTIYNWTAFFIKIASLFAFELLIKIRKDKLQINTKAYKNLKILVAFNIALFLGCVLTYFNLYNANMNIEKLIFVFFGIVLITSLITFTLVFRIEKESKKEINTKLKLAQIEMELKQYDDMIDITDNLRKLRHDMNNHIGLIRNLIYTKRYEELSEYVDQLYEDVEKANEVIISENRTLAVLLNAKQNKAKKLNIDFISVIVDYDIQMPDKDICTLLGNILDNAIEASEKANGKKFIDFSIQKTEKGCVISCENSYGNKPVVKKGKFISSKNNAALHGIGTENIKDIVSKYKGEVHFDFDEEVFNIRVVMPV